MNSRSLLCLFASLFIALVMSGCGSLGSQDAPNAQDVNNGVSAAPQTLQEALASTSYQSFDEVHQGLNEQLFADALERVQTLLSYDAVASKGSYTFEGGNEQLRGEVSLEVDQLVSFATLNARQKVWIEGEGSFAPLNISGVFSGGYEYIQHNNNLYLRLLPLGISSQPAIPDIASILAAARVLNQYWVTIDFQQIAALEQEDFYNPFEQSLAWQQIIQRAINDVAQTLLSARLLVADGEPIIYQNQLAYPAVISEQGIKNTLIALVEIIEKHVRDMFERMPDTVVVEGQVQTKAQAIQNMTMAMQDMKTAIRNDFAVNTDYFSGYLLVDQNDQVTLLINKWALDQSGSMVSDSLVNATAINVSVLSGTETILTMSLDDASDFSLTLFDDMNTPFMSVEGDLYGGLLTDKNDFMITISPDGLTTSDPFSLRFSMDVSYEAGDPDAIQPPTENLRTLEEISQFLGLQP